MRRPNTDVLNGIAWDGKDIYLTGKNWPKIFKVSLKEIK
jgi:glutamine cyclotransferase